MSGGPRRAAWVALGLLAAAALYALCAGPSAGGGIVTSNVSVSNPIISTRIVHTPSASPANR